MCENNAKSIPDYLVKLIEGFSTYAKLSSKIWITIALLSIVTLLPKIPDKINFFDSIEVENNYIYQFSFIIISILIISFGSVWSQTIRTRKLIQRVIDDTKAEYIFKGNIYLSDIIDGILYPSLARVAPLSQMLQGKHQFFPEAYNISVFKKCFAAFYYLILKAISILLLIFLPGYSLIISFIEGKIYDIGTTTGKIPIEFFWIIGIITFLIETVRYFV